LILSTSTVARHFGAVFVASCESSASTSVVVFYRSRPTSNELSSQTIQRHLDYRFRIAALTESRQVNFKIMYIHFAAAIVSNVISKNVPLDKMQFLNNR